MSGSVSGCTNATDNDPAFRGRYNLVVTQVADQSATLIFSFVDTNHNGFVFNLTGPLTHIGRLYQMANAQVTVTRPGTSPSNFPATIDSFHPTGQGIEGRWTANSGGGCVLSFHFAAVLNVNN
jgi:hypothetical protein